MIWLADTNYRIDLDNEQARQCAESDDYDGLYAMDQVGTSTPIKKQILSDSYHVVASNDGRRVRLQWIRRGTTYLSTDVQV